MPVEVHEQLLADGAVVVQQLRVLASFVEPHERVRQVEERDAALADDLQIGRPTERRRLVPLRGDVAAAGDLGNGPGADFARWARNRASSPGSRWAAIRGARQRRAGRRVRRADDARRFDADDVAAPIDHLDELPHVGRVERPAVFARAT